VVDSFLAFPGYLEDGFGYYALWGISDEEMFSVSRNIFRWNGSNWKTIRATASPFLSIYGTTSLNIFSVGTYNVIDPFNGTDWYRFRELIDSERLATSVWCDDKEVFVVSTTGWKTIIEHGK
jgi:hypothetical protein